MHADVADETCRTDVIDLVIAAYLRHARSRGRVKCRSGVEDWPGRSADQISCRIRNLSSSTFTVASVGIHSFSDCFTCLHCRNYFPTCNRGLILTFDKQELAALA